MRNTSRTALLRPSACIIRFQSDDKAAVREAQALTRAGFNVTVLLAAGADTGARQWSEEGVDYVQLPVRKHRGSGLRYAYEYGAWFLLCAAWMARESRHQDFRYVQVDTLPDHQVFATALAKLQGASIGLFLKEPGEQLVATLTGSARAARVSRTVTNRAIDFADVVFCVTEEHRQSYLDQGIDGEKLHVVLNANPPFPKAVRERPRDDGLFVLVSHGTMEPRYGHETIIEAAALARPQLPGLRVHLPGRGTHAAALEDLVRQRGLDDVVIFDGWLSDQQLGQLFADADLGVVAQEANAYSHLVHTTKMFDFIEAGVPIVASRLRATEALLPTEISYFDPGDAESLADALCSLASDPARREIQAAASLARLGEIGWETQVDSMARAVKRACEKSADR